MHALTRHKANTISQRLHHPAMVQIFLENFHNKEVCSVYTLSPNETVWDLKTAIEDEEGLPAGKGTLSYD